MPAHHYYTPDGTLISVTAIHGKVIKVANNLKTTIKDAPILTKRRTVALVTFKGNVANDYYVITSEDGTQRKRAIDKMTRTSYRRFKALLLPGWLKDADPVEAVYELPVTRNTPSLACAICDEVKPTRYHSVDDHKALGMHLCADCYGLPFCVECGRDSLACEAAGIQIAEQMDGDKGALVWLCEDCHAGREAKPAATISFDQWVNQVRYMGIDIMGQPVYMLTLLKPDADELTCYSANDTMDLRKQCEKDGWVITD